MSVDNRSAAVVRDVDNIGRRSSGGAYRGISTDWVAGAATFDSANILRRNAVVKRLVQIFAIASGGEICKLLL